MIKFNGSMSKLLPLEGAFSTFYNSGYGSRTLSPMQSRNFKKDDWRIHVSASFDKDYIHSFKGSASVHANAYGLGDYYNHLDQYWKYYNAKDSSFWYFSEALDVNKFTKDKTPDYILLEEVLKESGIDNLDLYTCPSENIFGFWFYGQGKVKIE